MGHTTEYLIYETARGWGIRLAGKKLSVFPTKAQAISAAISLAHIHASEGASAMVTGEHGDGQRYTIWHSERDAYTPPT